MAKEAKLKKRIREILSLRGSRGLSQDDLCRSLPAQVSTKEVESILQEMVAEHTIMPLGKSAYRLVPAAPRMSGIFHRNLKGFGFVTLNKGGEV